MIEINIEVTKPIVLRIKQVFLRYQLDSDVSIFLCGGASKEQAQFRFKLGKKIESLRSKYSYHVYYPETLFSEIANGHNSLDLLTLENVLAKSVNSIVIPLQSAGTFTELGAFTNEEKLKDKLVVIIKPQYRTSGSFINRGPIKKLKKSSTSRILYLDPVTSDIDNIAYKVVEASRSIATALPLGATLSNPIKSMFYFLCLIYSFDPISKQDISRILESETDRTDLLLSIDTSLANLVNKGYVELDNQKRFVVSSNGLARYLEDFNFPVAKRQLIGKELSLVRVEAINRYYRKQ